MLTGAKTTKSPLLGWDSTVICCGILGGSFYPGIRVLLSKPFTVYIRKHRRASFPLVLLGVHSSLLPEMHFPRNSAASVWAQSTQRPSFDGSQFSPRGPETELRNNRQPKSKPCLRILHFLPLQKAVSLLFFKRKERPLRLNYGIL